MQKKELVHKPNQTIMITNKKITANQRKAYNVVLYKAWNDLKVNPNQTLFKFSIADLKDKAGIKATNNVEIKDKLKQLKSIDVETVKENGDWAIFSLISSAEKIEDELVIELPYRIREALLSNDYYTSLDLLTMRKLEGKHSVPIYEMAIRYKKKQIPEMTVDELRHLTGTLERKSYDNFNLFQKKVLDPAIDEINEKTDILLSYSTTTKRKKIVSIKFMIKAKEDEVILGYEELSSAMEPAKIEEIVNIIKPLDISIELLKNYNINISLLKEYVDIILKNKSTVSNPPGALIHALKFNLSPKALSTMLKNNKIPSNMSNYEQRTFDDEYYNSLYENS